jgi:hypothetical protein
VITLCSGVGNVTDVDGIDVVLVIGSLIVGDDCEGLVGV